MFEQALYLFEPSSECPWQILVTGFFVNSFYC